MFTQKLVKKIKQIVPQKMMEDLHQLSIQCTQNQLSFFRDILIQEMEILMPKYDRVQAKDNIKNWITRAQQNTQIINNDDLELSIKRIVFENIQYNNMTNLQALQGYQEQNQQLFINQIYQETDNQELLDFLQIE
ncbi:Hypothetical_protein [Hexamita inflata]|uniref:Hypothetical_protein n=1 Tax=Hexamita inflata TaxID=28002 RepID=A0AA86TM49_9EUKA|nr:Hypothetical protein HINF_LOCUS4638 [Hexamita inflata]